MTSSLISTSCGIITYFLYKIHRENKYHFVNHFVKEFPTKIGNNLIAMFVGEEHFTATDDSDVTLLWTVLMSFNASSTPASSWKFLYT